MRTSDGGQPSKGETAATGDTATVTYLGIGLLVAALIVHCVAFRLCAVDENVLNAQAAKGRQGGAVSRDYVRAGVICAFCFFGYCWIFGLCQGFYPTFLQSLGMGVVESNNPATVARIIVVVVGVALGVVLEKAPIRKICSAGGLILFGGTVILAFNDYGDPHMPNSAAFTFPLGIDHYGTE